MANFIEEFYYGNLDPQARSTTGNYKVWQVIPAYFNFAEFTLTEKDAKEYKYSKRVKQRVHKWKDIKVKLYI